MTPPAARQLPRPDDVIAMAPVDELTVAAHLVEAHAVAPVTVDRVEAAVLLVWHTAEHRFRTPQTSKQGLETGRHSGHLRHFHDAREG